MNDSLMLVKLPAEKRALLEERAKLRGFRDAREWVEFVAVRMAGPNERIDEVETLHAQGLPVAYIGAALGLTNSAIRERLDHAGLKPNSFRDYAAREGRP